eukprot:scaffold1829_cov149-Skeletonema_marinoi.AAC.9
MFSYFLIGYALIYILLIIRSLHQSSLVSGWLLEVRYFGLWQGCGCFILLCLSIKQAVLIDVDSSKPCRLHGTQIRPRNGLLLVTKSVTEQQQLTHGATAADVDKEQFDPKQDLSR